MLAHKFRYVRRIPGMPRYRLELNSHSKAAAASLTDDSRICGVPAHKGGRGSLRRLCLAQPELSHANQKAVAVQITCHHKKRPWVAGVVRPPRCNSHINSLHGGVIYMLFAPGAAHAHCRHRQCVAMWTDKLCALIILAFQSPIPGSLHNLARKIAGGEEPEEIGWRGRIYH